MTLTDKLYKDANRRNTIQLQLSTNNSVPSLPDTPTHHMNILLPILVNSTTEDRKAATAYIETMMHGDAKTLFMRCGDVCQTFALLGQLETFHFSKTSIQPKRLLAIRKNVWGVSALLAYPNLLLITPLVPPCLH